MADFIREIGGKTRLMIREGPGEHQFQFFVQTGADTYNYQQKWSWGLNQGGKIYNSPTMQFRMEKGGAWQYMGWIEDMGDLGSSFDIRLTIHNAGLGFPSYDFWQHFDRARRPDPPRAPHIGTRWSTFIDVIYHHGAYDGGSPILETEIWYSDDPNHAKWLVNNTSSHRFNGLTPGVWYYFWTKARNAKGWSDLGHRNQALTMRVPDRPYPIGWDNVRQNRVHVWFGDGPWNGDTPVREWQISYGLDPNGPQHFRSGNNLDIGPLEPGRKYYFWSQTRNDVGWSGYSDRREVTLIAGARVRHRFIHRRAVPWVKVNGVWRLARPWIKYEGSWRISA